MSVDQVIIKALTPLGYPVVSEVYAGTEEKYIIFKHIADVGTNYGDNEPLCQIAYMEIHFCVPLVGDEQSDYQKVKQEIREALFEEGFTYPKITTVIDQENNIKKFVYECEIVKEREEE